jgi:hypothetical protein
MNRSSAAAKCTIFIARSMPPDNVQEYSSLCRTELVNWIEREKLKCLRQAVRNPKRAELDCSGIFHSQHPALP